MVCLRAVPLSRQSILSSSSLSHALAANPGQGKRVKWQVIGCSCIVWLVLPCANIPAWSPWHPSQPWQRGPLTGQNISKVSDHAAWTRLCMTMKLSSCYQFLPVTESGLLPLFLLPSHLHFLPFPSSQSPSPLRSSFPLILQAPRQPVSPRQTHLS